MNRIDDEQVIAFVDGELDEITRSRVDRAAADDPELFARIATQRRLRSKIAAHYAHVTEEEVPNRLRSLLESNVANLSSSRQRRSWTRWQNGGAIAASLMVGLIAGKAMWRDLGPIAVEQGRLVARGDLARSLDSRLAGQVPEESADARIGITFASSDSRICRTFDGFSMSGLACHGDRGWQLLVVAPGAAEQGEYRQASAPNPIVMAAAQELIAGEPFGIEAERQARDSGWSNLSAAD